MNASVAGGDGTSKRKLRFIQYNVQELLQRVTEWHPVDGKVKLIAHHTRYKLRMEGIRVSFVLIEIDADSHV